uniref:Uncharacterized protein n=1 Tax=Thermosporothrix sp. COM3 TaxID=2490863 RepID=A0A455SR65_9CHLR|nr:hypothetical protein KTC_46590 [Thermosporothrix sp. COM3]
MITKDVFAVLMIVSVVGGLLGLLIAILMTVSFWKIFEKAGFSGALALIIAFIPLANIIMLLWFAFTEWPIEQELQRYRAGTQPNNSHPGHTPTPPYPPQH